MNNKKIFMCVNYPKYNKAIGISKKIQMQIEAFEKLGYTVVYSAYSENGIEIYRNQEKIYSKNFHINKISNFIRRFYLLKTCIEYLKVNQFDLAFVRWDAVDRLFLCALAYLKKSCNNVLMDFHGYFPNYNVPGIKGIYTKEMTRLNGNKMKNYVDYGITETKNKTLFGIPTLPIDTGIDVKRYKRHQYCGSTNILNMISVANETVYHGYDRVLRGLSEYITKYPSEKVYIHLVGKISDKTIKLIHVLKLEKYVCLYGYLSGDKLYDVYNQCNVGIGPLAPHRMGGKEGTGIKTKEYFAIGLPYFYAGQELMVPDDYPYVMKIGADDSPVCIMEIIKFYNQIKEDKNMQENMRSFARENFSWETIFKNSIEVMGLESGE